jgi:hypothetical protein
MKEPPEKLNGAAVLSWVDISENVPTGKTEHRANGKTQFGLIRGLAIATYADAPHSAKESGDDAYLFYCDAEWRVMNDTWHRDVASAVDQAEFELQGSHVSTTCGATHRVT